MVNREGWIVKGEWYETIRHLPLMIHIFVARGNESARNEQTRHPRMASERRPMARNQPPAPLRAAPVGALRLPRATKSRMHRTLWKHDP
ncbi:hypothetical protein EHLJMEHL_04511 [Vreelandella titanicae]